MDHESRHPTSPIYNEIEALSFKFFMKTHMKLLPSIIDKIIVAKLDHIHLGLFHLNLSLHKINFFYLENI